MRIFERLEPLAGSARPRAVAVGNFDGLHLGHQRILRRLVAHARRRGVVSLLLTFAPHPEKVLGQGRVLMIQPLSMRLDSVRAWGVDEVLVMPFDADFASLTPAGFIDRILVRGLNARAIFLGKDFRFGRERAGTVRTLERYGARTGRFKVRVVPPVKRGGRAVSSSLIRELLLAGDVARAAKLLGRPYELRGRVVRGAALGRSLGFPTANIRPQNEILPPGIFLSLTTFGGRPRASLTYIGSRPTLGPGRGGPSVEIHLLRCRESLYGRVLRVGLLKRLRSDRRFRDAEALAAQIRRDVRRAESFFRGRPAGRERASN